MTEKLCIGLLQSVSSVIAAVMGKVGDNGIQSLTIHWISRGNIAHQPVRVQLRATRKKSGYERNADTSPEVAHHVHHSET
ncbi:MAG: hypothetical protein DMG98_01050 [Acidobacteria bacterium]|nr:MAG: hypothetical protein DMG98_01050 [Acidobacteriota bacterium]